MFSDKEIDPETHYGNSCKYTISSYKTVGGKKVQRMIPSSEGAFPLGFCGDRYSLTAAIPSTLSLIALKLLLSRRRIVIIPLGNFYSRSLSLVHDG